MESDLLHLVETGRGTTTKELFLEIVTLRRVGTWPHKEPVDIQALQLALFGLQTRGLVRLDADGWWPASHVQKTERREFDEAQQEMAF